MKRIFIIGLISILVLGFVSPAHCDNAVRKLGRGICNVLTSPFEMFEQPKRANIQDGPMAGLTYGLLKGVLMTGVRAVVGVYEIVTFPIPLPKGYRPILTDPEFFFEEMSW